MKPNEADRVVQFIVEWIQKAAARAGASSLVVGLSGGIDSALVALLCKKTGLLTIPVVMPCHSTPASTERAFEFCKIHQFLRTTVKLDDAWDIIASQTLNAPLGKADPPRPAAAALRSCLRAPVLDFVGKINNGIIIGTGNCAEDRMLRYFQKRGDGAVDISPIADLYKEEVRVLAKRLGCTRAILDAIPSADLWGAENQTDEGELGISYDEIEWADQLDRRTGIITGVSRDLPLEAVPDLRPRHVEVLQVIRKWEQSSRHKVNPNIPVCEVRALLG